MAIVALLWLLITSAAFLLPNSYPIMWTTFNYAPVAVGSVAVAAYSSWWLYARKHCSGPLTDMMNSDIVKVKSWIMDPPVSP